MGYSYVLFVKGKLLSSIHYHTEKTISSSRRDYRQSSNDFETKNLKKCLAVSQLENLITIWRTQILGSWKSKMIRCDKRSTNWVYYQQKLVQFLLVVWKRRKRQVERSPIDLFNKSYPPILLIENKLSNTHQYASPSNW